MEDDKSNSNIPFDIDVQFTPSNQFTMEGNDFEKSYGVSTTEAGLKPNASFLNTAAAEFYDFNATLQLSNAGINKLTEPDPFNEMPDANWNPSSNAENFYDIQPQYKPALLAAKGPQEQRFIRDRILAEQQHNETLENGSTLAKIVGGLGGAVTDPISYIPIANYVKYAKIAPAILKNIARTVPGALAFGTLTSAAKQLDHVNGNLNDFIIDAGINTVFASTIFGGIAGVSLALDKMELWGLRDLAKSSIKGIDFKFTTKESGELTGIKAIDTTGNLSAAEVSYAQELANSSFHKSGVFKIPYVGSAILALKSYPGIGSPLLNMLNSPYQTVRGFIDRAADHSILTKNVAEGGVAPKSFELMMKQEFSDLRSISAQLNALHLERNGFESEIRPLNQIAGIGIAGYNKALKLVGKDIEKTGYVGRETFDDEVQRVLFSEESSEHAAVNEAASLLRTKMDDVYKAWKAAYNLPEDIIPPRTAAGYLMRVYDTPYMNINKDKWVNTISNYLAEADQTILNRMQPINEMKARYEEAKRTHELLLRSTNKTDAEVKKSVEELKALRSHQKSLEENLQNELRADPDLHLHIEDVNAFSANEAKAIKDITKRRDTFIKSIEEQKKIIQQIKQKVTKNKTAAMKGKRVNTATKNLKESDSQKLALKAEEKKLHELEKQLDDELEKIQDRIQKGEINPRFYYKEEGSQRYTLKDPSNRLKFRDLYDSHFHREVHAKAAFDTIMHQTPEDTIADVMGKLTGNGKENHLKKRTLLVPDKLLYDNNFMTKDLMSKLSNYSLYLSRRTNLKNVFKDVTQEGGIEPILQNLNSEFKSKRNPLDLRKEVIKKELSQASTTTDVKKLEKELKKLDKDIEKETKKYRAATIQLQKSYERMMGLRQRSKGEHLVRSSIMSITAMTNLHFLPATQVADLGAIGLQHGVWPFVRDAVYPVIESLGGILKTKDSEALRKSAPSVHLALQDMIGGYGDKNWAMEAQPYLNLGSWVGGIEKMAHFSANTDLTTYIENGMQRLAGATVQAEFMRILHAQVKGTMSKKDSEYIRKYGIDPEKWGKRMVQAYKEAEGYKTKLGGYQSKFWEWQDMEAANVFSDAVFKGIQNTIINRGTFDSPFWADNMLGMLFHTFTGWGYASVNRYLVPLMQRPDAEKMLGVLLTLGFGSLVSPLRRTMRGEDAYPEGMTNSQKFWEALNDSSATSAIANTLSWANLLSNDKLLGDLKNDKYRNRTKIGATGPVFSTANRMYDILSALSSGEMNEKDAKQMARMLPIFGSTWGYDMSKIMIENLGLPRNRQAAAAENA